MAARPWSRARGGSSSSTAMAAAVVAALAVMLIALAASASAKPLEACPPPCRCFLSEGLKRADCRHVPEWAEWAEWADDGQPSDAQDVRVLPPPAGRGARSAALHLSHFEVFPKVLQLSVTNRSLVEIIPSGFHGLRSLQVLDLSHNLLSRFNYKVFLRMPALRRLVLAGNPVALEAGVPLLVSKSLLSLDLSHCDVVDVPRGSLDGLRNLTALSLRGNPLRLEAGRPLLRLATLAELDLSACELEAVPAGVLDGLAGLRRLYLDGNSLHTVARGVLPRGLHHLDLSGNQIRDAPTAVISSLRNLTKLELSDNPITCTCSLIGLQGWLSRSLVVTERPVVCADPAEYRGKSWTKVDELQLCREEEKKSSNVSESSSSSDESSSADEDSAAALPDDLDDDSLELPPASYEQYTHENYLGGQLSGTAALPLKVKKLDSVPLAPRGVGHNDISLFQADQPYDYTTARSLDESGEASSAASVSSGASTATEVSTDHDDNREPLSGDDEDSGDGKASVEEGGDDDDSEVEEDAETFMRNADTIAMGKSMPGKAEDAVASPEEAASSSAAAPTEPAPAATYTDEAHTDSGATDAGIEDSRADDVTTTASTEDVEEHHIGEHLEETSLEDWTDGSHAKEDLAVTSGEGHEEVSAEVPEEIPTPAVHDETSAAPETTTTSLEEATPGVLVGAGEGDRAEHGRALDVESEASSTEGSHGAAEHHDGEHSHGEATTVPDLSVSPGLPEHAEDVGVGPLASSPSPDETPTGEAAEPTPAEAGGEGVANADAETTATPAPRPEPAPPVAEEEIVPAVATNIVGSEQEGQPAEVAPEHRPEAEDSANPTVDAAVVPPVQEEAELEPEAAAKPEADPEPAASPELEPEPLPEAKPEDELEAKPETVPEAKTDEVPEIAPAGQVPVEETVPPPKTADEAELVPVLAPGVHAPEVSNPDNEVETVGGPAPGLATDGKHNEGLAVERVPPAEGDGSDPEAQFQKSTITYVILGCIVVTMVVLTLYALLRSKAKQTDTEKGLRIRRDNGDARNHHGLPEGTEMKDMMNPLLGSGAAQPELTERRGSLVSLELIREVEEDPNETTRLQPNGAGGADHAGGAQGAVNGGVAAAPASPARAASEPKPTKKTPDTAKRQNGTSNGKAPAAAGNGQAASAPAPATTTTPSTPGPPGQQRVAEQPSKVKVKAGVISTPVPRTPVLVNRVNGAKANGNGLNRSA